MKLYHSYYDKSSKILYGTHESGFYSCINEVRNSLYRLVSEGIHPESISFINTLHWYRENEDLYPILYRKTFECIPRMIMTNFRFKYFCPTELDLKSLDYFQVKSVELVYFQASDVVENRVKELEEKYQIDYSKTLAVLHRGTDKATEAILLSPEEWISHIESKNPENFRVLIQTDEKRFRDMFTERWGNNSFVFDEMIFQDSYVTPQNEKVNWSINFEAIMRIISKCKRIVTHSGNCGIIPIIYRGNLKEVSQCYKAGRFINFE